MPFPENNEVAISEARHGGQEGRTVELTVDQLVPFAMQLHKDNRFDLAEKFYRTALEAEPRNANAMHFLGVLMQQIGRIDDALIYVQQSIDIDGNVAAWHNNLGNLLLKAERFDAAAKAYARCSELDQGCYEVLNNLGVLFGKLGRITEAEASFCRAIKQNPTLPNAHLNLSALCSHHGRVTEGFSHLADALALSPNDHRAKHMLVTALGRANRVEEGLAACRKWLESSPQSPYARHFLAALGGVPTPDRAADEYVVAEFDGFAASFDAKLTALEYRAPQLVGDAVARIFGTPVGQLSSMDAGCGTGLCGPFLRPYSSHLQGVDLSANMLNLAGNRKVYDVLKQAELVECLSGFFAQFDLIVSADTLCYFGKLANVFSATKQALRQDGYWIFTVESHEDSVNYILHVHGRYSHSREYLEAELQSARFTSIDVKSVTLRSEGGKPVTGWLIAAS
jgi:predicted TPR repeat methyltransferase